MLSAAQGILSLEKIRVTYSEKHLLQSSYSPFVPVSIVVYAIGITAYEMFGQNHDKTLKGNKRVVSPITSKKC